MTDQTPETEVVTERKRRISNPLKRSDATADETSKPPRTLREKAKTVAAVVGVVAVGGAIAAAVANKKSAKVEVTLPDVDITTEA